MKKQDIKNNLLKLRTSNDLIEITDIDDLNVKLYFKPFKALQRMRITDKMQEFYGIELTNSQDTPQIPKNINEGHYKYMVYTLYEVLVDEDGNKLFDTFDEALDIIEVFPKGYLIKIHEQIMKHNGLEGEESVKKQDALLDKTEN